MATKTYETFHPFILRQTIRDLFGRVTYFEVDMHSMNNVTLLKYFKQETLKRTQNLHVLYTRLTTFSIVLDSSRLLSI